MNTTRESITILKRGHPVAQLTPPLPPEQGYPQDQLRDSVQVQGDIESPVLPPPAWEAESGRHLKALLDTHILVRWVSHPDDLNSAQRHAVGLASAARPLLVATIRRVARRRDQSNVIVNSCTG